MYYLLDTELNLICPIELYKSMIWTTRYYESGDFELYMAATPDMLTLMKKDYYIVRDDDFTQAMIIENVQITTDKEEGDNIIVTGRSLKSILARRIIWSQTTVRGRVEACIRRLVDDNAISPSDQNRKISRLILGAELGLTETMTSQFTGDNLEVAVQSVCKKYGIGYDVLLDLDSKQFIFILFKGEDRSWNQSINQRVIFSNEFDNLLRTDYNMKSDDYKNVALVAGEGEGVNRRTMTVGTASDLERYELFVDARSVSSNNGQISAEDYNKSLAQKGVESLSKTIVVESIEGEVEPNYTYKINEDYFLGDIVEVVNEYGIIMTPRITEIIESDDDTGHYTIPTFATDTIEE